MCHIDYISFMWFSHKCEKKRKWINHSVRTFWSPLTSELVTSTEYMAVIKSHHFPPPPPPLFLFLFLTRGGGGWGGCAAWTRQIVLVSRRPQCSRRRRGRLSLWGFGPLASPAWLFEAVRWPHRATSLQVGGGGVGCVCRGAVGHLYTAVSFILSSSPSSSSSHFSISALPLLFLCCCCFTPSPRPLQAL